MKTTFAQTSEGVTQSPLDNSPKLATTAYTDNAIRSRTPDGYLQSDGATANRAQIYGPFDAVNNPREWIAGAASLTIAAIVTVPTSNPSVTTNLIGYAGGITTDVGLQLSTLSISLFTNGTLNLKQIGSAAIGDQRLFNHTTFRSLYSGQTIFLKATFTQGTTNPIVEVNGVNISASFSASTSGTPPVWLDATMVPAYRLVGYNWPSGPAPIVTPILGTTSAADDAFYMSTGKWPAWVAAGGGMVDVQPTTSAAGLGAKEANSLTGWSTFLPVTLSSQAGTRTGGSGSFFLRGVFTAADTNAWCDISWSDSRRRRISFWARGSASFNLLSVVKIGGTTYESFTAALTTSWQFFSWETSNAYVGLTRLGFDTPVLGAASGTWEVDDFTVIHLGALSLPSIQPINVVDDVSGIGGNQGRLFGMTPVTDKHSTRIIGRINAASATNQQILGGALLPVPLNYAHEFVDVECDGSVTLSLGDGTTATRYTASTALTAGRTRIALTTPFAADAAKTGLYVNVTVAGGTYAQFSILGHLLK